MWEEPVVIAQDDVVLTPGLRHEKVSVLRLPEVLRLLMKLDIAFCKVWPDLLFNGGGGGRCVVRDDDFKILFIIREYRFDTSGE